ncbi:unnamed protein product [Rotaria sordida]|uniref:Uncharacterized protein n=1 Tax=Rotaria sordida TaxID=392033 RepID=A0A815B7M6_9BILA|nr:unnamed protein product [Rotaria sordida]CAF1412528.1 unnamed protein product [Rotaria sordida]CAF1549352.1 unnamed protein product [Rotaria sordida]CAF1627809.1 unnamed protein product [Rotaria sordida]
MSSSFISFLLQTNQRIMTYGGISIFIIDLVGEILNIVVFLSLTTFRETSCAFYLTILSIVNNIGQLITSLLTRIIITEFNINWIRNLLFYCKFRIFASQVTIMRFLLHVFVWQQLINILQSVVEFNGKDGVILKLHIV